MKKLALVAVVAMVCTGVAFAISITVPLALDNGPDDGAFPPAAGTGYKSYVNLTNTTGSDILLSISAHLANGAVRSVGGGTPGSNTALLPANSSRSFRSLGDDASEGAGQTIPNVDSVVGDPPAISLTLTWAPGATTDIVGRLLTVSNVSESAYLLPDGQP